ncbi:MAG: DNA adenine methylase [Candidatus Kapabacteria bacterium]|nr:DNA adenine methylase [Candidatus Kapabacteria bacterium]
MINSPLRYPGGKSKAVKYIAPFIPDFDEYREPFLGGGSMFIYLKQRFPEKKFLINDIYENLYLFWKNMQSYPDLVINQIQDWKDNFKNGKELHKYLIDNIEIFNEIKRAAAFFVINRITFSGTSESGGFSESAFQKRFTQTSIERLKKIPKILNDTIITNMDYQRVIELKGNNVFIFLDPPYFSTAKSALYGKNGNLHKSFDHKRFAELMKNIHHKWLITYDDSDYIRDLFSFANIKELQLTYGMRNVGKVIDQKRKELLISNYPLKNEIAEFSLFSDVYCE